MMPLSTSDYTSDVVIKEILETTRTIALIGASDNPDRPSYAVMKYLKVQGYQVIPVNPFNAGKEILGEPVFGTLSEISTPIDMVDIFRKPDEVGQIIDAAITANAKAIWMQIGVVNQEAAKRATAAGLLVIMDRCPKIEIPRLKIRSESKE
tara:strand:+ start:91 stop:543 length:453 start_codon:yes stop_codon:yes gene_type:complete